MSNFKVGQTVWTVSVEPVISPFEGAVKAMVFVNSWRFLCDDGETAALVTTGHWIGGNGTAFLPLAEVFADRQSADARKARLERKQAAGRRRKAKGGGS